MVYTVRRGSAAPTKATLYRPCDALGALTVSNYQFPIPRLAASARSGVLR